MTRFRFDVNRDRVRAGFEKTWQIMIGPLDHEMNVERQLRVLAHRREDCRAERNVIDEMSVHDVEMQPVRARFFRAMNFGFEIREIGGENRRSDQDFWWRHNESAKRRKRRTPNAERPIPNFGNRCGGFFLIRHWAFGVGRSTFSPFWRQLSLDDQGWRFMLSRSQAGPLAVERSV